MKGPGSPNWRKAGRPKEMPVKPELPPVQIVPHEGLTRDDSWAGMFATAEAGAAPSTPLDSRRRHPQLHPTDDPSDDQQMLLDSPALLSLRPRPLTGSVELGRFSSRPGSRHLSGRPPTAYDDDDDNGTRPRRPPSSYYFPGSTWTPSTSAALAVVDLFPSRPTTVAAARPDSDDEEEEEEDAAVDDDDEGEGGGGGGRRGEDELEDAWDARERSKPPARGWTD